MEPALRHRRKDRIAEPAVQYRHRSRHHLAAARRQAASLYQVVSFAQFFQEPGNLQKIVAAVGVTHDDEFAASGCDTTHQGAATSCRRNADYSRAELVRDL